jgi:hypothetical protein
MAGALMRVKGVDAVVTGADRIASNGDTANKIGTYQVNGFLLWHVKSKTLKKNLKKKKRKKNFFYVWTFTIKVSNFEFFPRSFKSTHVSESVSS